MAINKEPDPHDLIDLGSLMKKSIIITLVAIVLLLTLSRLISPEPATAPVQATSEPQTVQVVEEPVIEVEKPVEEPEIAPTWRDNPNNCDTETQWIWEDTTCHDKPKKPKVVQSAAEPRQSSSPATASSSSSAGGTCEEWKAAAGIPSTSSTRKLINHESGCRTNAVNPKSGACGIPQAWPCSKLPCPLNNSGAVCQLKWMDNYVKSRYGSWDAALNFWYAQCNTSKGCWY